MTTQQVDRPRRRSFAHDQARDRLDANLRQSRAAALRAATQADKLRDTSTLAGLHEVIVKLDDLIGGNDG